MDRLETVSPGNGNAQSERRCLLLKIIFVIFIILVALSLFGVVAAHTWGKTWRSVRIAFNCLHIVVIAMGCALMIYAVSFKIYDAAAKKGGVFLTAEIILYEDIVYEYEERTTATHYVYQYEVDGILYQKTNGNEDVTGKVQGTPSSYYVRVTPRTQRIGQSVDIYYPEGRPQDAIPVDTANMTLLAGFSVGGCMVFFTLRSLRKSNRPVAKAGKRQRRRN